MHIRKPRPLLPGIIAIGSFAWNGFQAMVSTVHFKQDSADVWDAVVRGQSIPAWTLFAVAIGLLVWSVWGKRTKDEARDVSEQTPFIRVRRGIKGSEITRNTHGGTLVEAGSITDTRVSDNDQRRS